MLMCILVWKSPNICPWVVKSFRVDSTHKHWATLHNGFLPLRLVQGGVISMRDYLWECVRVRAVCCWGRLANYICFIFFVLVSCAARRCHSVGVHFQLAQSQYQVARHGETGRCAIAFVDRCQFCLGFPGLAARAAGPNRHESIVRVPSRAHLYMFVLWFSFPRSHSHDLRFSTGTMGLLESSRA